MFMVWLQATNARVSRIIVPSVVMPETLCECVSSRAAGDPLPIPPPVTTLTNSNGAKR
jgi:hypothetical protein